MNVLDFPERKKRHQRIVMVTCYDATSAGILAETSVDMLLVGDSAAMVMHGHDTTLPIDVADIAMHVRAVRAGAPSGFIVADLPFLATRKGQDNAMTAIETLMKAGANAVKIEGIRGHETLIRHVVESGVPVMGHLGLTPQSVNQLGGFRVQGRDAEARDRLLAEAKACETAGCFALVLECVPDDLATRISQSLTMPTIGIGAGDGTDGQVLVMQDLLGLGAGRPPKFVRRYLDGRRLFADAFERFARDVRSGEYPDDAERYAG
jgi:3-methyl-2-oxobutanoate hydroxymethyltransferase